MNNSFADLENENKDSNSGSSPKTLSEFDRLKMDLEEQLSKEAEKKEKEKIGAKSEALKSTLDAPKSVHSKTLDNKKSTKTSNNTLEKVWLLPAPEDDGPQDEKQSTYIVTIKMFDRGLVINGFPEDTSLYTLSRTWMKNSKTSLAGSQYNIFALLAAASKRESNGPDVLRQLQNGEIKFMNAMPAIPKKDGEGEHFRVPTIDILCPRRKINMQALNDIMEAAERNPKKDCLTSKADLLAQHKLRWKRTKSNWIKHIRSSDKHYEINFAILDTLYKSQMKIIPTLVESSDEKLC